MGTCLTTMGTCLTTMFRQIIHISFFFRQIKDSSPVNGTQIFIYLWYPREHELKDQFSKIESMKIGRFSNFNFFYHDNVVKKLLSLRPMVSFRVLGNFVAIQLGQHLSP